MVVKFLILKTTELTINLDEEVYIVYRDNLNQKSLARESVS